MSDISHTEEQSDKFDAPLMNPFEDHSHQTSVNFTQQENSYPVCLDSKNPDSRNTPFSRLSEVTYSSQIKIIHESGKGNIIGYGETMKVDQTCAGVLPGQNQIQKIKYQYKKLFQVYEDLKCYTSVLEKRNEEVAIALQKQKLKSCHLEQALSILRKDDQNLDKKINQQAQLFVKLRMQFEAQKDQNLSLRQKIQQSIAQNNYLKQLILIANNNYEGLEKKYIAVVQKNKKMEEENLMKEKQLTCNMHQMKNLLTNIINNPSGEGGGTHILSFNQQDENCVKKFATTAVKSKNQKKQTEQIYRKMFIKTLKGKK